MKKEITIYTNKTCPYCKLVKKELEKNDIKFEEKLTEDYVSEWSDVVSLTTLPSVPTVIYKDNFFIPGRDFQNAEHLLNIINNFQKTKVTNNKDKVLESIKTLNYQINMAFGNLDQVLKQIETKLNKEDEK